MAITLLATTSGVCQGDSSYGPDDVFCTANGSCNSGERLLLIYAIKSAVESFHVFDPKAEYPYASNDANSFTLAGDTGWIGTSSASPIAGRGNTRIYVFDYSVASTQPFSPRVESNSAYDHLIESAWAAAFRISGSNQNSDVMISVASFDSNFSAVFKGALTRDNELVLGAFAFPKAAGTPSTFSSPSFSQSGATFNSVAEVFEFDVGVNTGIGGLVVQGAVTTGAVGTDLTIAATASGDTANLVGPAVLIRLVDAAAPRTTTLNTAWMEIEVGQLDRVTKDYSDSYTVRRLVLKDYTDEIAYENKVSTPLDDAYTVRAIRTNDLSDSYTVYGFPGANLVDNYSIIFHLGASFYDAYIVNILGDSRYGRPIQDLGLGGWTSTGANAFSVLDETIPDDADYVSESGLSQLDLKVTVLNDPASNLYHKLRVRTSSAESARLQVELYQGGTGAHIATWQENLTPTPTTYIFSLTEAQAALIDRYWDLRARFTTYAVSYPTIVQGASATVVELYSVSASFSATPKTGNVVLVFVGEQYPDEGTTMTLSDNLGNVYTEVVDLMEWVNSARVKVFATRLQYTGPTLSITATCSTTPPGYMIGISLVELANVSSIVPDALATSPAVWWNDPIPVTIPITTTFPRTIVFGMWFSWDDGFTVYDGWNPVSGAMIQNTADWHFHTIVYKQMEAAGTYAASMTITSNSVADSLGVAIAFKGY